jgi:hypothetical protein
MISIVAKPVRVKREIKTCPWGESPLKALPPEQSLRPPEGQLANSNDLQVPYTKSPKD